MKWDLDRNLFMQTGLDSGSLTILGSVVRSFPEPGEYRGSVHKAGGEQAVFYLSVDKESPAAHVNIDLASLPEYSDACRTHCCDECGENNHFAVNPRGYVVFHVSKGSGGFSVHLRQAKEDAKEKAFNSQELGEGDIFAASIIRPGTYRVVNRLTKAEGAVVVSYPEVGKTASRPPAPVRVQVGREGFEPARVHLMPSQGLVFDIKEPARIVIDLTKADDGPSRKRTVPSRGWSKQPLLAATSRETASSERKKTARSAK
jgi:hypothetical protein